MELVTRLDSRWETKAMLMDHFVDGFLFKLFLAKWDKICWREHAAQLALECIQALSLVNISFNKPDFQSVPIWSSALQICACVLLIEEELREITLWFLDRAGAESSKWAALKLLYKERLACGLRPKVSTLVTYVTCVTLHPHRQRDTHTTCVAPTPHALHPRSSRGSARWRPPS